MNRRTLAELPFLSFVPGVSWAAERSPDEANHVEVSEEDGLKTFSFKLLRSEYAKSPEAGELLLVWFGGKWDGRDTAIGMTLGLEWEPPKQKVPFPVWLGLVGFASVGAPSNALVQALAQSLGEDPVNRVAVDDLVLEAVTLGTSRRRSPVFSKPRRFARSPIRTASSTCGSTWAAGAFSSPRRIPSTERRWWLPSRSRADLDRLTGRQSSIPPQRSLLQRATIPPNAQLGVNPMGRLVFSLNVTLDGCIDHQEGIADDETHAFFTHLMDEAGAMLWGRVTYEMMEGYWPAVARGDQAAPAAMREWAVKLEAKPKYVVSSTRTAFPWTHSHLISGDLRAGVQKLKEATPAGVLLGSGKLANELDRLDLIDEYRFLVHPRIAGHGPTLYQGGLPGTRRLELVSSTPLRNGAVAMHHRRLRA